MQGTRYSIVIPTLNQASKLRRCLSSLSELSFEPSLFEVLVIDNGSTDNSRQVALSFEDTIRNLSHCLCANLARRWLQPPEQEERVSEFGGPHPDYLPEDCELFLGDRESALGSKVHTSGCKVICTPRGGINQ